MFDGSKVAFQRSVAFVRPTSRILPEYLLQATKAPDFIRQLERRSNATAQAGLYLGELAKIIIPIMSLHSQHRATKLLRAFDRAIEKTEALIEKYQQIKTGLMHDLFTRGIGADGRLRSPREESPELYEKTIVGWIPKEWDIAALDAIKESLVDGPFGSNLKTEHYVADAGTRVVRLQNIQSTKYNDSDKAFISDKHADSLVRNRVSGGDVLIAGLGEDRYPVGRACIYPKDLPSAINKADCFRLRCVNTLMINDFIAYFLNTFAARLQVRKYEQGVTRPRINLGNLNKLVVPCPSLWEQASIVDRLARVENSIRVESNRKRKVMLEKNGLMHDLLTGTVSVGVEDPELVDV